MPPSAAGLQMFLFLIDVRPPGRLLLPFTRSITHCVIPCVPSLWTPGRGFEHRSNLYSLFFQSSNPKKRQASNLHCILCLSKLLARPEANTEGRGHCHKHPPFLFPLFFHTNKLLPGGPLSLSLISNYTEQWPGSLRHRCLPTVLAKCSTPKDCKNVL